MNLKRRTGSKGLSIAVLTLGLSLSLVTYGSANEGHHWSYEGEGGPEHWGSISEEFAACSKGKEQSPVDISGAREVEKPEIVFNYGKSKLRMANNGHTIQVNYDKGSYIKVNGSDYQLVQFHFHDPSEHTLGKKPFDMELHLVHKNGKGQLAVVGVFIESGRENEAFKEIWSNLPKKAHEEKDIEVTIDAMSLLPATKSYYRYAGSLTTPPCSEKVTWLVIKTPIQMSQAQIDAFKEIIKNNNRPVQPLNDRKINGI